MKKTIIGSGIYNLDQIYVRDYPEWPRLRPFNERLVTEEVGGTCGNVMTILAWMGWKAMPQASFDNSPEGLKLTSDLKRYGCDCRYVSNTPDGGTTMLRCTHKKDADGKNTIAFRTGSPGGSRFPRRRFIRKRDQAPAFLEALTEVPSIYFFDDPAAGHRMLARELGCKGAIVYFEPSAIKTKADLECIEYSNIIKFSNENVPDTAFIERFHDKLFIQTMGAQGLRFKLGDQPWVSLPACPCEKVVDWEGAGDWTSATFINCLASVDSFNSLNQNNLRDMLTQAQKVASQSVAYLTSKGMIHAKQLQALT